ncbi:MAG: MaoC/PaaZ C-terminal domain-containing protein [Baekduia sp.]
MTDTVLERSPSAGDAYRRAAVSVVLERLGRGGSKKDALPNERLILEDVAIDRHHLAAYNRVCAFQLRDELPATYLHNLTFPLQMELMTRDDFPFPVVGMVHVENRIEQHRSVLAGETPTLRVWAEGLRPHRAGTQLDLVGEALIDGEVVWRDVSTYLKRGSAGQSRKSPGRGTPPAPRPEAVWSLSADLGRQFAAVSGDRNPIHMSSLSAKAFGFPSAIAHGMWLKARCVAAIDTELADAFTVQVAFQRPVLLPSKVGFATAEIDGRRTFTVHNARKGTPHLRGSISV